MYKFSGTNYTKSSMRFTTKALMALASLMSVLICQAVNAQDALCYTEQVSTKEKGFLGVVNRAPLYYEAWNVKSGGMYYSAIVLRTDTVRLNDSIDFCLDVEHRTDSVFVSITRGDSSHDFATTRAFDVPTLLQVLEVTEGYRQFRRFNEAGSDFRISLKDDKLYLTTNGQKSESAPVTEVFALTQGQYKKIGPDK